MHSPHPVLAQLLEEVKAVKFQVLLCWKLDRFAHSHQELLHSLAVLTGAGIRFLRTSQPILDTGQDTANGQMPIMLLRAIA
jgi:DNA invertase Pin-like site-specific DNA recombinase